MKYYYILHIDFADIILDRHPKASMYNDKKLVLTRTEPKNFKGEVVDLSRVDDNEEGEVSYDKLNAIVDQMLAETPTGRMVKVGIPQGKHLYDNHVAFKPKVVEEV